MIVQGTDLTMTRGDSEDITVTCQDDPFAEGDTVTMTVRKNYESGIAFQKVITEFENGAAVILIEPGDTEGLDFGAYIYDVQVDRASGIRKTPVKPSRFTIDKEVTF